MLFGRSDFPANAVQFNIVHIITEGGSSVVKVYLGWGCAARKSVLFRTPSMAKGILLAILVYAFWQILSRKGQSLVIPV